jgi:hypothetical protein
MSASMRLKVLGELISIGTLLAVYRAYGSAFLIAPDKSHGQWQRTRSDSTLMAQSRACVQ